MRLSATSADLSEPVVAALANPPVGQPGEVTVEGTSWPTMSWGDPLDPPLLLIHGVTSNAGIWWRVGPAIAAGGRRVVAVDMPGHGRTQKASRSHRFADTAAEVAAFVRAAGLDRPDLGVVGHSWGGMVTAHLPAAGLAPRTLVLLDPPVLTLGRLKALTEEPTERHYATFDEAMSAVRAANPGWSDGDVQAKAEALTEFSPELVLDVLLVRWPRRRSVA
jgi:pimeloyl-ACP methyl ester carboxylesterase